MASVFERVIYYSTAGFAPQKRTCANLNEMQSLQQFTKEIEVSTDFTTPTSLYLANYKNNNLNFGAQSG